MKVSEAIREYLASDPSASELTSREIAEEVSARFGVRASAENVRMVMSRDARSADQGTPRRTHASSPRTASRVSSPREPEAVPPRRSRLEDLGTAEEVARNPQELREQRNVDKVILAVEAALRGDPQHTTAPPAVVREYLSILDDPLFRGDFPGFNYTVEQQPNGFQRLEIYAGDIPPGIVVPAKSTVDYPMVTADGGIEYQPPSVTVLQKRTTKRGRKETGCEWCGKKRGIDTKQLYRVRGAATGNRELILCQQHAIPETQAGAAVRPYEMPVNPGWGVIRPELTAYARHLASVVQESLARFTADSPDEVL